MDDPRKPTLGTLLRTLIEKLDGAVEEGYVEAGLDYRPRYTPIIRALLSLQTASIRAIAVNVGISHSAASQTVAQMAKSGLVKVKRGADARENIVSLSKRAKEMIPVLERLWAITNQAAKELDQELRYPISQLAEEAIQALEETSFAERRRQIALQKEV